MPDIPNFGQSMRDLFTEKAAEERSKELWNELVNGPGVKANYMRIINGTEHPPAGKNYETVALSNDNKTTISDKPPAEAKAVPTSDKWSLYHSIAAMRGVPMVRVIDQEGKLTRAGICGAKHNTHYCSRAKGHEGDWHACLGDHTGNHFDSTFEWRIDYLWGFTDEYPNG